MARSRAKVDVSDLVRFENRLRTAAAIVEEVAEDFEGEWGGKWADDMKATVPVASGHLRDSIEQVEPGGITFGDAYYWRFLEYGTSKMSPQPFVRPTMKRIRTPARKDAGERAMRLIQGGL